MHHRIALLLLTTTVGLAAPLWRPTSVAADPAPFGLALGVTTVDQARTRYSVRESGINRDSNGPMFALDVSEIDFEGLTAATLVFDADGVLVAVLTELSKHRFPALFETLRGKYRLVESQRPFFGDQYAKYLDGDTEITLSAPHLSFTKDLIDVRRSLVEAADRQRAREASPL